jgi:hypothetical protein
MRPLYAGLRSYILVEPITGFALAVRLRLQLNLELHGGTFAEVRPKTAT